MPDGSRVVGTIERVAVVGAGYMGGGIAQSLARAGFTVVLADASPERTRSQLERLLAEADGYERAGLFDPGDADRIRQRLSAADSIEDSVADVDFVHEAVFEDVELKTSVLGRISAAARPDAVIGTNTSTIPVRVLAAAVTGPGRFLTVHWSNPATFVPGVEVVTGEATDPACLDVVGAMLSRAGRRAARVADSPGFVLNRLQYTLFREAADIVAEGIATPEDVDTIVSTTFGFRYPFFGPFATADIAGLDTYAAGMRIVADSFGERLAPPKVLTDLVDEGRLGAKTGSGFTVHDDPDALARILDRRDRAYAAQLRLLADLDGPPTAPPAAPPAIRAAADEGDQA